jgi:hypothetical protein
MSNLIQIKRSLTNANPTGLANGELAFTANGGILFIGSPNGSVVPIAGARTPGILTANQALVANTTSGIDKINVANLVPIQIFANGGFGTSGQLLASNGSSLYWATPDAGVAGANTQIQFNDNGTLAGNSNFTFNKDTTTLNVGTATINSTSFNGTANNATNLGGLSAASYQTTAGLSANVATLTANNSTNLNGQPASFYTNASNLSTGTVATARLGSGTANANTFLSGDQSYKTAVTSIASGNGLTGGPISTTGTLAVQAGDGIVSNSSGTYVQAGTGVTVNSTGVHIGQAVSNTSSVTFANLTVTGNTVLGDATSDVVSFNATVNTNIIPAANVTYSLGNTTVRWSQVHAANVHSVTGIFDGNVEIAGNLVVVGNLVTTNVSSVIVADAKILLAANNPGDILDIGFSGTYTDGGSTVRHAGLFRDASDNGVFKFFANTTQDLTGNNVIDLGATGYTTAILETFLKSGALSTNAGSVAITANSTVNVDIVANTLTLSTALAGNNGGTGLTTVTNNAILVGNATNGYTQLTLGTAGRVLQSNGTALVYDVLDGGTF